MKAIPLYPDNMPSALANVEPLNPNMPDDIVTAEEVCDYDNDLVVVEPDPIRCERCSLHKAANSVCIPPDGKGCTGPGGLLVITSQPGHAEDEQGRPNVGGAGRYIRSQLAKRWDGPVAYDNAIKCYPGSTAITAKRAAACRPYLATTLLYVKPSRILCFGSVAALVLTGRKVSTVNTGRRAWTYVDGIPCFFLPSPVVALRNEFDCRDFEQDLAWALTATPESPADAVAYIVRTPGDAAAACHTLGNEIAFDCETYGDIHGPDFGLLPIAVSRVPDGPTYVWDELALVQAAQPLADLLADSSVMKWAHNSKYDATATENGNLGHVQGDLACSRLIRSMVEPGVKTALDAAAEQVGMGGHKAEADKLITKIKGQILKADVAAGKPPRINPKAYAYAGLPYDVITRYVARDALSTAKLAGQLRTRLQKRPHARRHWEREVRQHSWAVSEVERWGIKVDVAMLTHVREYLTGQIDGVKARFCQYGEDFNPNSPTQLRKLLFDDPAGFNLRPTKMTKTGLPSTDADVLQSLIDQNSPAASLCQDVISNRSHTKLLGTYVDGIRGYIRPGTQRVHPSINLDGARTGRPSCSNPNLMNIPRSETETGKLIRDMYCAPRGYVLVQGDLSQAELRVAAALSGDERMREIFFTGADYHLRTAHLICRQAWGITPDQCEPKHRSWAKTVNFALLYGTTAYGLAHSIGCSPEEAEDIVNAILGSFPGLAAWMEAQKEEARRTGYVWTQWQGQRARRRPIYDINSDDDTRRKHAENQAINTPPQGEASDLCMAALVDTVRWLKDSDFPGKAVLTVYDSIMLEVREDCEKEAGDKLRSIMEARDCEGVPIVADISTGRSWGSLQEIERNSPPTAQYTEQRATA